MPHLVKKGSLTTCLTQTGYREVLGAAEGMRKDKVSWVSFF